MPNWHLKFWTWWCSISGVRIFTAQGLAVKRNLDKFPDKFMFRLTELEFKNWVSQIVIPKNEKMGLRILPHVFTEVGVIMLSSVLRSTLAVEISIRITRAFVGMRKLLKDNVEVFLRLENVERKQLMLEYNSEKKFDQVFNALQSHDLKPKQGIFYDGQVFDAYSTYHLYAEHQCPAKPGFG